MKRNAITLWLVVSLLTLFSCTKSNVSSIDVPTSADSVKVIYLNYTDFISPDDVVVDNYNQTSIAVSDALLDKLGETVKRGNVLTVWNNISEKPFFLRVNNIQQDGQKKRITGSIADISDVFPNISMQMSTEPYFNHSPSLQLKAIGQALSVSPNLIDEEGVIHPAVIVCSVESLRHIDNDNLYEVGSEYGDPDPTDDMVVIDMMSYAQRNASIKFRIGFEKKFDFSLPVDKNDDKSKMGLSGTLKGGLGLKFTLETSWFKLKKFEGVFFGDYGLDVKLSATLKAEKVFGDKDYVPVGSINPYWVVFAIGPIPVAISIEPTVVRKIAAKISGEIGFVIPFKAEGSFEAGVGWTGSWYSVTSFSHKEQYPSFENSGFVAAAKLEAEAGLYVKAGAYLAGLAGPYILIGPRVTADAEASLTNLHYLHAGISSDIGVRGSMGAELKVWKWSLGKVDFNVDLFKINLFKKEWDIDLSSKTQSNGDYKYSPLVN